MLFFGFGGFLVGMAVLIFSAGRMERGDELWRLRLDHPSFRNGLEAGLGYALLTGRSPSRSRAMGNAALYSGETAIKAQQLPGAQAAHVQGGLIEAVEILVEAGLFDNENLLPKLQDAVEFTAGELPESVGLPPVFHV